MDYNETKFVDFYSYCRKCENVNIDESEDPCDECLSEPVNSNSHKPINFKEKVVNDGRRFNKSNAGDQQRDQIQESIEEEPSEDGTD